MDLNPERKTIMALHEGYETIVCQKALGKLRVPCGSCGHMPKKVMRSARWTKGNEKSWFLDILVLRLDSQKKEVVECQWCAQRFGDTELGA